MSRNHVSFKRVRTDGRSGRYEIRSEDFEGGDGNPMALVGEVIVNVDTRTFQVLPCENWLSANVFPPHLFGLGEETANTLLASSHRGYTCFPLARHVYRFASHCFDQGTLPEEDHRAL